MYHVQSLCSILLVYDARNIYFTRPLTDHLNVDVPLSQCGKHSTRYSDHITHVFSN